MEFKYLKNGAVISMAKPEACNGCGMCVEVCPHAVFAVENRKAVLARPEYCMECGACAKNCTRRVIYVKSGVGCAAAIIASGFGAKEVTCGCGGGDEKSSCCG